MSAAKKKAPSPAKRKPRAKPDPMRKAAREAFHYGVTIGDQARNLRELRNDLIAITWRLMNPSEGLGSGPGYQFQRAIDMFAKLADDLKAIETKAHWMKCIAGDALGFEYSKEPPR